MSFWTIHNKSNNSANHSLSLLNFKFFTLSISHPMHHGLITFLFLEYFMLWIFYKYWKRWGKSRKTLYFHYSTAQLETINKSFNPFCLISLSFPFPNNQVKGITFSLKTLKYRNQGYESAGNIWYLISGSYKKCSSPSQCIGVAVYEEESS